MKKIVLVAVSVLVLTGTVYGIFVVRPNVQKRNAFNNCVKFLQEHDINGSILDSRPPQCAIAGQPTTEDVLSIWWPF